MSRSSLAFGLILWISVWEGSTPGNSADVPDLDLLRAAPGDNEVSIITFNIQFLGNFKMRRNQELAELLAPYDLIFVQELVAPPYPGTFPDGTPYIPDSEAQVFFDAMEEQGFDYVLSEEDTGTGPVNHLNGSATEWYVAFYRADRVEPIANLHQEFLAVDRSNHPDYERVPYAFSFEIGDSELVFISVHLQPGAGRTERARRAHELRKIFSWIESRSGNEADYVILGDMNIEDCTELQAVLAPGYDSLNNECLPTNTNVNGRKPYDHIMYALEASSVEINTNRGISVLNLIELMRPTWPPQLGRYPGRPYQHNLFRKYFSDHHPILFFIRSDQEDDD